MTISKDPKTQEELSVEEILASIRGVINGHSTKSVIYKGDEEDILELTDDEILISDEVADDAKESLKNFAGKVAKNYNRKDKAYSGVEELVINIIKPEIKLWLNANLPGIVRQIVEKEVQRLTKDS